MIPQQKQQQSKQGQKEVEDEQTKKQNERLMNLETINIDLYRQYKSYTTLLQIAEKRGYFIPEQKKIQQPREFEIKRSDLQRLIFFADKDNDDQKDDDPDLKKALGIYCNFQGNKVTQDLIHKFVSLFSHVKFDSLIFVVYPDKSKNNQISERHLNFKFSQHQTYRIQLFKQDDLLFNVLKHDLVPQHRILNNKEKEEILAYYKVKQSQLPKILTSDPVARFLGLRKGQVVKIIRKSQTAGLYTTYRVAV